VKFLNHLPFIVLLASLAFLSVWGAGVFPSSVCIATAAMCVAAAVTQASAGRRIPVSAAVAVGLILLVLLSALPLPGRTDSVTGKLRRRQNDRVRAALAEARQTGVIPAGSAPCFSHSRNRSGSLRIGLLAGLALCAAVVAARLGARARDAYLRFLVGLLVLMSVMGFLHQWIRPAEKTIWWVFDFPHGSPVGCFVNRTHHAGFIALVCPVALALFVRSVNGRRPFAAGLYAIAFAVMAAGILSSLARGAILATGAGVLAVIVVTARRKQWLASLWVCALVCFFAVGSMSALLMTRHSSVSKSVVTRLSSLAHPTRTFSGRARLTVWRDSLRVWRDYPLTGAGPNGFRAVFPLYRTRADRQDFVTPENEYVELLTDGGVVGLLAAALLAGLLVTHWRHGTAGRLLPDEVSLAVAGSAAVAAVHNGVDVPMHTPLYAMTFASLVGMVFPAPGTADTPFLGGPAMPARVRAALLLLAGAIVGISCLAAGTEPYRSDLQDSVVAADAEELSRALVRSPTSWAAWYHFGLSAFRTDNRVAYIFGEKCMTRATECDPKNYRLWEALGHVRVSMGYDKEAREAFERMHELRPWKRPPRIRRQW